MERALLTKKSADRCRCVLCERGVSKPQDMGVVLAQKFNGHHIFCGTSDFPCPECEGLMLAWSSEGVEAIRARAECELLWRNEGADLVAAEQASLYFRFIEPGRVALWDLPVWMSDVADIGDTVRARAEREIYEAAKRGGKG
jgi:hypothetical protein